jgi:alkylated DNA repair dioxygenase AlkB
MSINLLPHHGELFLKKLKLDSNYWSKEILSHAKWRDDKIKIFGKEHTQPRLVAWFSDSDVLYTYSGIKLVGADWPPSILKLKEMIELESSAKFNSLLINYYRDGKDYMGWHSDDEEELGENPLIASLSFGATRDFKIRYKKDHKIQLSLELEDNHLLIMKGECQHFWHHCLPKRLRVNKERLNLTFRLIK